MPPLSVVLISSAAILTHSYSLFYGYCTRYTAHQLDMPTTAERYKFHEVETDGRKFLLETAKLCKVDCFEQLTNEIANKAGNKGELLSIFVPAMKLMERQHNLIMNQRVHVNAYKSDIIQLQEQVITLQGKLLSAQRELLDTTEFGDKFKTDIVNSVQEEVKSFKQSFSDVVKSGSMNNTTVQNLPNLPISEDTIKSVAKQIVVEEELSRNVIVFGLCEVESEDICAKVTEVFESLGEKPRVEASRLGKKSGSATRPVKVTLSSSTIVQQILKKSSKLSRTDEFKTVYLAPDRTVEERAQHKELVVELKRRTETEKDKKLFIRGGKICSIERHKQS